MKLRLFLFALLVIIGCTTETKTNESQTVTPAAQLPAEAVKSPWEVFWVDFQEAVVRGDVEKVSRYTEFPLKGSEVYNDGKQISKATFEEHFSKIFDATVVEKFKAGVTNMSDFATKNQTVADQLNVPTNKKVRSTMIMYVHDEGTDHQTESSVTFQFVEVEPGQFKLYSLVTAG